MYCVLNYIGTYINVDITHYRHVTRKVSLSYLVASDSHASPREAGGGLAAGMEERLPRPDILQQGWRGGGGEESRIHTTRLMV